MQLNKIEDKTMSTQVWSESILLPSFHIFNELARFRYLITRSPLYKYTNSKDTPDHLGGIPYTD